MLQLFDFYIKSSFHVSLAVTAFAYITSSSIHVPGSFALYLFIFCSTLLSYNFTKYLVLFQKNTVSAARLIPKIIAVSAFALAGVIWSTFHLNLWVLTAALIFGLITLAYGLPVFQRGKSLRRVYGVKIFIIAFVWAGVTVLLPILSQESPSFQSPEVAAEFTQRLLYVIALTLPFDIRDLHFDTPGLGTIPQLVGVKRTKLMGFLLLLPVLILELIHNSVNSASFLVLFVIVLLTGTAVWQSVKVQPPYFASFWVEGLPIFWAILLFLTESG